MKKKPVLKITFCHRNSTNAYWHVGCEQLGVWYGGPKTEEEAIEKYMVMAKSMKKPYSLLDYQVEYAGVFIRGRHSRRDRA